MAPARKTTPRAKKSAPPRTPDAERCSELQRDIANRARIVLSLCDQEAGETIPLPEVALGFNRHIDGSNYQEHSMVSRLLRALRNWKPEHLFALAKFAAEHGVDVDPGWIAFGNASEAPPPIVPADCELRSDTKLEAVTRSPITLRQLRARRRRARGSEA